MVVELLDSFAEVGFIHCDTLFFKIGRHAALIHQHRFPFGDCFHIMLGENVGYNAVVFIGVFSPVHDYAVSLEIFLKHFEIVGEMAQCVQFNF